LFFSLLFREDLDRVLEYMDDKETPQELRRRVVEYMNFVNSSKFYTDKSTEDSIFSLLT
jgi:hypothetical protein